MMDLYRHIESGNIEAVKNALDEDKLLLESKNIETGLTILATACIKNKLNIVEILIDKYKVNVELKSNNGETSIYAAIASGNEKIVKFLIDRNVDVNSFDSNGKTPLIVACVEGELNIIKLLINAGAEVNLQDDEGYSPLHIAVDSYNGPIYEDILIYLAERGADSELKTNTGETALHRACIGGHFEAVRMLILMEVDLDARDNYGWYPLHSAASKGRNDIIGLLLEAHCDINCTDMKGYTPLHRAILKNQVPTVEFLLLNDANVKMITDDGNTPLCMVCASSGSVDLANILILEGTIISAKYGPDKISPLHLAATKGHTDLVRVLVSVGISPNVRDISGMTPLHRAAFKGQTEMAQLLISLGSDPLLKDGSGATPYDLAVDSSHQDTAAYLKEFQR